jgi:Spy/CpxP family protein refolding chaperone
MVASTALLAVLVTASLAAPPAGKKPDPATGPPAAALAPAQPPTKSARRLPPHFNKLVTDEQRQQIYEIQAAYSARVKELQAQLHALRGELNTRCEEVLSPDQRQQLAVLKAEAMAKRAAAQAVPADAGRAATPDNSGGK